MEELPVVLPVPGQGDEATVFGAGDVGVAQVPPVVFQRGAGLLLQVEVVQVHQQAHPGGRSTAWARRKPSAQVLRMLHSPWFRGSMQHTMPRCSIRGAMTSRHRARSCSQAASLGKPSGTRRAPPLPNTSFFYAEEGGLFQALVQVVLHGGGGRLWALPGPGLRGRAGSSPAPARRPPPAPGPAPGTGARLRSREGGKAGLRVVGPGLGQAEDGVVQQGNAAAKSHGKTSWVKIFYKASPAAGLGRLKGGLFFIGQQGVLLRFAHPVGLPDLLDGLVLGESGQGPPLEQGGG